MTYAYPRPLHALRSYSYRIGRLAVGLSILFFWLCVGCGHSEKDLANNPKLLWEVATDAYDRGDWTEARKYYERFTQYFPQNKQVGQAKLRIADSWYEQYKFFEAEVHYESFVELYPEHAEVGYAWYRLGLSQKEQVSGIVARDLRKAREAIKSFTHFLSLKGADSNTQVLAREHIHELDVKLMNKEFEIGSWYFKLGHYQSAFLRFESLLKQFAHLKADQGERLYLAAVRMIDSAIELKEKGLLTKSRELFGMFSDHKDYANVVQKMDRQDISTWN